MTWKLLISRLFKVRTRFAERLARWWKYSFYLYLAGLFTLFAVLDTTVLHFTGEMRQAAFDTMVRYRLVAPKPDPDIIIVDINEASLAAMAKDAEFEADRIAVVLAMRAGYDAFGLPAVLQQIGHFAKDDGDVALLFKTHPHPDDRLGKLGSAMGDRFDTVKGKMLEKHLYRIKP